MSKSGLEFHDHLVNLKLATITFNFHYALPLAERYYSHTKSNSMIKNRLLKPTYLYSPFKLLAIQRSPFNMASPTKKEHQSRPDGQSNTSTQFLKQSETAMGNGEKHINDLRKKDEKCFDDDWMGWTDKITKETDKLKKKTVKLEHEMDYLQAMVYKQGVQIQALKNMMAYRENES